ncbi:ABC transporter permease, partial [Clostridium sp. Cult2]|uniref:ABC transporter permease n=1 Tax=Clostridium sp. Cult2 TaxID=2079003 RepID=UPI001F012C7E
GIVAMQSLGFTSLNALMLIGVINGIDKSLFNSSLDLGGNSSYTITKILIPLMRPGIIVVGLLTFVRSLADFSTPIIIGGSFNVLATHAYLNVVAYSDLPMAAAISILLFIPAIIAFILYRVLIKDSNIITRTNFRDESNETMIRLEGFFPRLLQIITFIFLTMMILQYMSIFLSAITKQRFGTMYFTLDNIRESKNYISGSIIRSILYSFTTGVIGSILGFLISYYLEIRKIRGMKAIDFISTIPYIIPGTFFGLGYILAFNRYPLELTGTGLIVILNCIFKQLPLPTKVSSAVISQINPQITEACKDLGAHELFMLKDVVTPMSKSAFLISFVNNFTATMTTIGSIIFLVYPGKKLATLVMFDAIQSGKYRIGSVIACLIILITLTMNIIFSKFLLEEKNVY